MGKNKSWVYAKVFKGEPKITDFELREEDIPAVKDGGRQKFFSCNFCIK